MNVTDLKCIKFLCWWVKWRRAVKFLKGLFFTCRSNSKAPCTLGTGSQRELSHCWSQWGFTQTTARVHGTIKAAIIYPLLFGKFKKVNPEPPTNQNGVGLCMTVVTSVPEQTWSQLFLVQFDLLVWTKIHFSGWILDSYSLCTWCIWKGFTSK